MKKITLVYGKLKQELPKDHAERVLMSKVNKKAGWKLPKDSNWVLQNGKLVIREKKN